jgi:hypothetical protein
VQIVVAAKVFTNFSYGDRASMIFGFNTDVKHGDTVYHVQSEANPNASLLLTTIFVRGRCLGKKSTSYASDSSDGGSTELAEQRIHELLKEQHRQVLDAIRAGEIEKVIAAAASS